MLLVLLQVGQRPVTKTIVPLGRAYAGASDLQPPPAPGRGWGVGGAQDLRQPAGHQADRESLKPLHTRDPCVSAPSPPKRPELQWGGLAPACASPRKSGELLRPRASAPRPQLAMSCKWVHQNSLPCSKNTAAAADGTFAQHARPGCCSV